MRKTHLINLRRLAVGAAMATPAISLAAPADLQNGATAAKPTGASDSLTASFNNIANTLIFLVGAVSVLVLIYGGFRYVSSTGNAKDIEAAKNTIIYAVIGLVVAILAYAIVNFVITNIK